MLKAVGGAGPVVLVTTLVVPPVMTWGNVTESPATTPVPPFRGTDTFIAAGVLEEQLTVSVRVMASPGGVSRRSRNIVPTCTPGITQTLRGMPGVSAVLPRTIELTSTGPQLSNVGATRGLP